MIYVWPHDRMPKQAVFISDLHLMSTRSTAEQHHTQIASLIERNEMVVWGGDLFDFRWSRFSSEVEAVDFSLDYLQQWRNEYPEKQFVFLCGNHDASPIFLSKVTAADRVGVKFYVCRRRASHRRHGDAAWRPDRRSGENAAVRELPKKVGR
ncbi:hypothetical protein RMSM_03301 [Rhodopirellula maiorica SM1]|uniref:Calcineurin-like phosphoesterase domain-containing protein n=1 Tax=Rhodopirellula maiorica SM1 TaxID=1265738 RepID=M5RKC6_9BACT|nr:hypothetical protein RMSM_03301 [Rhodopirellula maiorica SM1]